jgi:hypothetical protein
MSMRSDPVSDFGLKDKRTRSSWKPFTGSEPVHGLKSCRIRPIDRQARCPPALQTVCRVVLVRRGSRHRPIRWACDCVERGLMCTAEAQGVRGSSGRTLSSVAAEKLTAGLDSGSSVGGHASLRPEGATRLPTGNTRTGPRAQASVQPLRYSRRMNG